jgi:hypothetical protein
VLGILTGLWKVRIGILQHGILIAMAELFLQADIPGSFVVFGFYSALCGVLIVQMLTSYETGA